MDKVTTLREGNTPLYDLYKCAADVGVDWLLAKHQGMNPTGSFQDEDTGMTAALFEVAAERGFEWSRLRLNWQHVCGDGRLRRPRRASAPRRLLYPRRQDRLGASLSQSMDYGAP